jgi:hypothetical protein
MMQRQTSGNCSWMRQFRCLHRTVVLFHRASSPSPTRHDGPYRRSDARIRILELGRVRGRRVRTSCCHRRSLGTKKASKYSVLYSTHTSKYYHGDDRDTANSYHKHHLDRITRNITTKLDTFTSSS